MKKPLLIGVSALALLAVSATLFAQTATGSSLITEMKAGVRAFTLAADLNPGITGLQSAPVSGKKTGDQLTANEWNRVLELLAQGGGGGGGSGLTLSSSYPVLDCFEIGTTDYTCTVPTKATLSATPTPYTLDLATVSGVTVPAGAQYAYICGIVRSISSETTGGAVSIGSGPGNVGASSPSHPGSTDRDHGGDSNCWFTPLVQTTKISYTFNKGPTDPLGAWGQISLAGFYGGGSGSGGGGTGGGTTPAASAKICFFVYTSGTTGSTFNSHAHAVHGTAAWTSETCRNYLNAGKGGATNVYYYLGCVTDAGVTYGTISPVNPTTASAGIPSPNCGW